MSRQTAFFPILGAGPPKDTKDTLRTMAFTKAKRSKAGWALLGLVGMLLAASHGFADESNPQGAVRD